MERESEPRLAATAWGRFALSNSHDHSRTTRGDPGYADSTDPVAIRTRRMVVPEAPAPRHKRTFPKALRWISTGPPEEQLRCPRGSCDGSSCRLAVHMFSVLGVFLFLTKGDAVIPLWLPVALGLWLFRPKDWRDALHCHFRASVHRHERIAA